MYWKRKDAAPVFYARATLYSPMMSHAPWDCWRNQFQTKNKKLPTSWKFVVIIENPSETRNYWNFWMIYLFVIDMVSVWGFICSIFCLLVLVAVDSHTNWCVLSVSLQKGTYVVWVCVVIIIIEMYISHTYILCWCVRRPFLESRPILETFTIFRNMHIWMVFASVCVFDHFIIFYDTIPMAENKRVGLINGSFYLAYWMKMCVPDSIICYLHNCTLISHDISGGRKWYELTNICMSVLYTKIALGLFCWIEFTHLWLTIFIGVLLNIFVCPHEGWTYEHTLIKVTNTFPHTHTISIFFILKLFLSIHIHNLFVSYVCAIR